MNSTIKYRHDNFLLNACSILMLIVGMSLFSGCGEGDWDYTVPSIPLVSADYDFDQFGGNGTIVIGEIVGTLSASCEQEWLTSLLVNGSTVSFTVTPNTSIRSRVAEIFLKSGNITSTVIIAQESAMFTNKEEYIISSDGGVNLLEMPSGLEYSFTIDPEATWITSSQIVSQGLSIDVEPASSILSRSAKVILESPTGRKSKTFTVIQEGYDFGFFPEALNFAFEGGSQNIIVSGKRSYSVSFDAPWLTFEKNAEGGVFTAASNVNGDGRTASVTFTDESYGAVTTFVVTQDPDPAEYEDYLGDWEIMAYGGNKYIVTLSVKEEKKSFYMTSESWPGLKIEVQWSTANNGRRLAIFAQQLATNSDGSILLYLPAYTSASGGASFYTGIGSSASYFKFDGVSTIICDGGTSAVIDGFILFNRNAANTANVGWYSGGPNRFTGTVLNKIQ